MEADRRPGRPRDARVDAAVLEAAGAVLAEHGFSGATVEAIAARAGVGKAAIYRRWPNREALLLHVMLAEMPDIECPDTGSLRNDLVAIFTQLARHVAESGPSAYLGDVIAESARNPELAEGFQRVVEARRAMCGEPVRRAHERGELRVDVSADLVIDVISGSIFYRKLFTTTPADAAYVADAVDAVLHGVLRP